MPALPSPFRATLWIARYRLRALLGSARVHAFELLVLAPMILGGAFWVLHRSLGNLRPWLLAGLERHPGALATTSLVLVLALTALQLPAVWRELFGRTALSDALDASPTPPLARWNAALLAAVGRNTIPAAVLGFAAFALAGGGSADSWPLWLVSLVGMAVVLALVQLPLALMLVRFRLVSDIGLLAAALMLAGLALLPAGERLLLPWWPAAALLHGVLGRALGAEAMVSDTGWLEPVRIWGAVLICAVVLLPLGTTLYLRWWRGLRDVETASRRPGAGLAGRFEALLPSLVSGSPELRALVVRDLRLVWRRFSAAVPLAFSVAGLIWAAMLLLLAQGGLTPEARSRLVVLGGGLVAAAVATLVPLLLAHQLPRLWMEKGSGVDFELLGKAKSITASLLVTPWLLATAALPLSTPEAAKAAATSGLVVLAGWMSSSMVAAAVWEIASRPMLGLVLSGLLGLGFAALLAFYPQAWWLWLVLHLWMMGMVGGRAGRRVRFTEIER